MGRRVCLGGTFNTIHDGHMALLKKALESGDEVHIGLTSDKMASRERNIPVRDYDSRLQNLNEILDRISGGKSFFVFPLDDPVGPAGSEDFDVIVVSSDTLPGAVNINDVRKKNGRRPLEIVVIDMVLARDGNPISSTRILKGHIGPNGSEIP